MPLQQLQITNVRNLATQSLDFDPHLNVFFGENGSGKTSILEAIYMLGLGRSFRSTSARNVVAWETEFLRLVAKLDHCQQVGVERYRDGSINISVNSQVRHNITDLAVLLPIQTSRNRKC